MKIVRCLLVVSLSLLNVYMAWASRLLRNISPTIFSIVNGPIQAQDIWIWRSLDLARYTYYTYVVADLEALALLLIVIACAVWLDRRRGLAHSVLRSLQVASASMAIFGAEIAVLDQGEFKMHVTDFQMTFNFIPWFNNQDMLASAVAVFGFASLLLRLRPLAVARLSASHERNRPWRRAAFWLRERGIARLVGRR